MSAVIGAFRSSHCFIVPASSCSLSDLPLCRSRVAVYLDRGHPCLRNFNSTILFDVIWVKSDVNSFLHPTYVPVKMSIVGVFRNDGGLGTGASYIPFVFFDPLLRQFTLFPSEECNYGLIGE